MTALLAVLALVAGPAPAARAQGPGWVRWEGRYFVCWLPSRDWRVAESMSGVDITSPTGDAYVGFAYATNAPGPVSTEEVIQYVFSSGGVDAHPTSVGRVLRKGQPVAFAGGTRQVVEWTGTRQHRLKGRQLVRGILTADVFSDPAGGFGFSAYTLVAPKAQWRTWAPTLATIQKRIVFMGRG